MYGKVFGVAVIGVRGRVVTVEAHVGRGLPSLTVSGLPGTGVLDGRERVRPAVESSGLEWPLRRVVVNLSPANMRKEGPGFDLPIAMGVLAASAQVPATCLPHYAFAGELSLKGELVPTPGILAVAMAASAAGLRGVVVPRANGSEASLVEDLHVVGVSTVGEAVAFLRGQWVHEEDRASAPPADEVEPAALDLAEVRGQGSARRALEIAAAGGHNVLLVGPPGAGKTMLARRLPTILPTMTRQEALDVTRLHSVAGLLAGGGLALERPFRSPHHTISAAGLLGGGTGALRPGEVSLAHNGVLFLDEVTEFRRDAVEGLRQPLEDGRVLLSRVAGTVELPARFTLVAASNPCPCGFEGDPRRACRCLPHRAQAYRQRLSGPLLDRVDIQLSVPRLTKAELLGSESAEPSATVRDRVEEARLRQRHRLAETPYACNAQIPGPMIRRMGLAADAVSRLSEAVEAFALSGRGFDRAVKVGRTIADLEGADVVTSDHIGEALSLRTLWQAERVPEAG